VQATIICTTLAPVNGGSGAGKYDTIQVLASLRLLFPVQDNRLTKQDGCHMPTDTHLPWLLDGAAIGVFEWVGRWPG
jgi:hypothetical protein